MTKIRRCFSLNIVYRGEFSFILHGRKLEYFFNLAHSQHIFLSALDYTYLHLNIIAISSFVGIPWWENLILRKPWMCKFRTSLFACLPVYILTAFDRVSHPNMAVLGTANLAKLANFCTLSSSEPTRIARPPHSRITTEWPSSMRILNNSQPFFQRLQGFIMEEKKRTHKQRYIMKLPLLNNFGHR